MRKTLDFKTTLGIGEEFKKQCSSATHTKAKMFSRGSVIHSGGNTSGTSNTSNTPGRNKLVLLKKKSSGTISSRTKSGDEKTKTLTSHKVQLNHRNNN